MGDVVKQFKVPVRIEYTAVAGSSPSLFLREIKEGRIVGQRCPATGKVYVPPRGSSPTHGVVMTEEVPVKDTGVVTSFCIVNIPFPGQTMKIPYVGASIVLDGADSTLFHVIGECDPYEVRMGMRVKAVWKPPEERGYTLESIRYFKPTGEPDADQDSFKGNI